jgi:spore maturation protein CgeB
MQARTSLASSRLETLLLTLSYPHRVSYYDDWSDAFSLSAEFNCTSANILDMQPAQLARRIEDYDAIIALHSCNADTLEYFAPLAPVLGERKRARLVNFIGNEFNSPYVSMVERTGLLKRARCDIIATQLLEEAGAFLYAQTGARVMSVPHALNPRVFKPGPAHAARRLDLGVKGYRYPAFLGDDDRNRLLERFQREALALGLNADISFDQRLSREAWVAFLCECRGTVSTEVGSWYLEPDDALMTRVAGHYEERRSGLVISNKSPLRRMARRLPSWAKAGLWTLLQRSPVKFEVLDDFSVPFAELKERFFREAVRAPVYGKAISSRHFDAVGTKTCQLMLRGRFNDIMEADRHYIPIDPSFADLPEAVRRFKDAGERQRIVDAAYEHVLTSHTYAHRAAAVAAAVAGV